jgi:hypothetical protein
MTQRGTGRAGKILVTLRAVHSFISLKEYSVRFYLGLMVGAKIQRQKRELPALLELR